jgi:hypothetical protein
MFKRYPITESLDGTKVAVRLVNFITFPYSWQGLSNDEFYKLADHFGIDNIIRKTEFENLLLTDDYHTSPPNEV